MKIALIGGGGARTPALACALATYWGHLPISELALYDLDAERLAMMRTVANRALEGSEARFRLVAASQPESAIEGASFVVVSVRVGGQQARARDERIALDHGCIGQETTGPAGLAYALRSIPVVQHYAWLAGRLAPRAWLINFTNPSGLVTQALSAWSPVPIVGVCDSPQVIVQHASQAMGIAEAELDWRYSGLNHLGWVTSVRHRGRELLPGLIADDELLARILADDLVPPGLVRHLGALPNEYCYYYYYRDEALRRQQAARQTRGEALAHLDSHLAQDMARVDPADAEAVLACYGRYLASREESYLAIERQAPRSLPTRSHREWILAGGAGYAGTAFKIIAGLSGLGRQKVVLNVANYGQIVPGLEDEDVIETLCEVTSEGCMPLPGPALPRETMALLQLVKAYERLAAEAALNGSRHLAVRALVHHPLVASLPLAESLVDAYLREHRSYLPRFVGVEP